MSSSVTPSLMNNCGPPRKDCHTPSQDRRRAQFLPSDHRSVSTVPTCPITPFFHPLLKHSQSLHYQFRHQLRILRPTPISSPVTPSFVSPETRSSIRCSNIFLCRSLGHLCRNLVILFSHTLTLLSNQRPPASLANPHDYGSFDLFQYLPPLHRPLLQNQILHPLLKHFQSLHHQFRPQLRILRPIPISSFTPSFLSSFPLNQHLCQLVNASTRHNPIPAESQTKSRLPPRRTRSRSF